MMQEKGISAIISPVSPHCAPRLSDAENMIYMSEYSYVWQLTGFPTGILPITTV